MSSPFFARACSTASRPCSTKDGEQTRDFSFVEDIARANWLVAESDKLDGLPVNVGSGRGVAVREVAEQIGEALASRSPRRSTANSPR